MKTSYFSSLSLGVSLPLGVQALKKKKNDDLVLKKVSRIVFELDENQDEYKLNLLCTFKGVMISVASAILTFYDPKNYGVFDIHIYDEFFGTSPKTRPSNIGTDPKLYIKLLERKL